MVSLELRVGVSGQRGRNAGKGVGLGLGRSKVGGSSRLGNP